MLFIDHLIDRYAGTEADLVRAMQGRAAARDRVQLLRTSADLLDQIERYEARSAQELREQVFFFLTRAARNDALDRTDRDVEIALQLMSRWSRGDLGRGARAVDGPAVHDYVRSSPERVSLISSDYEYRATSAANAAFYAKTSEMLEGVPVARLIGRNRFDTRARRHIDRCLGGVAQEYCHPLDGSETPRIMRCQMKPVRLAEDRPGVLVYMHDITKDRQAISDALAS